MLESMLYVVYRVISQANGVEDTASAEVPDVLAFLKTQNPAATIIHYYTDTFETRRNTKWPELDKALDLCKAKNATLLITELGSLASYESFTQRLLGTSVPFYCLDQPFVDRTILEALSKHAEVQRKLHGKLIKEGLKLTSARSGNPNAAEVISRVNKPKIDTAIIFAFLLNPIIKNYRDKGFSQRQMVKTLNEEGFTAPEGGKWVLSQLQKVLDRVRLNEIAIRAKEFYQDWTEQKLSHADMANRLNEQKIPPLKSSLWDESQTKKLIDRIQQINEITLINRFILHFLPLLHEYQNRSISVPNILQLLAKAGMPLRENDAPLDEKAQMLNEKDPLFHLSGILASFKTSSHQKTAGTGSLAYVFESAAKHLPVYLKIIKTHIEQLANVLQLNPQDSSALTALGLPEPVLQLMALFKVLKETDIRLFEMLAKETERHLALSANVSLQETEIS